jgi:hypothetical protein
MVKFLSSIHHGDTSFLESEVTEELPAHLPMNTIREDNVWLSLWQRGNLVVTIANECSLLPTHVDIACSNRSESPIAEQEGRTLGMLHFQTRVRKQHPVYWRESVKIHFRESSVESGACASADEERGSTYVRPSRSAHKIPYEVDRYLWARGNAVTNKDVAEYVESDWKRI